MHFKKDQFSQIESLIQLASEQDLAELTVTFPNGASVKAVRRYPEASSVAQAVMPTALPTTTSSQELSITPSSSEASSDQASTIDESKAVKSPMVGTFFARPSPEASAFVKEGDVVQPGQTLCLIEAMKMFNKIKAEKSGTIKAILVQDGAAVEFNQPLFVIED